MSSSTNVGQAPSMRSVTIAQDVSFILGIVSTAATFLFVCIKAVVEPDAVGIVLTTMAVPDIWAALGLAVITGILIGGASFALISFAQMALEE